MAGLDSYMPAWMAKVHPRYATPYAALIVHAAVSMVLIVMNFVGAGVQETFQKMLSLAVVLQLIPFLYMFAALIKLALNTCAGPGHYSKTTLITCRYQRAGYDDTGNRAGIFSGPTNQLVVVVRSMDVRRHVVLHRTGGILLLRLRQPESKKVWARASRPCSRAKLGNSRNRRP